MKFEKFILYMYIYISSRLQKSVKIFIGVLGMIKNIKLVRELKKATSEKKVNLRIYYDILVIYSKLLLFFNLIVI